MNTHSIQFGKKHTQHGHSTPQTGAGSGATALPMAHHHSKSPTVKPTKFGDHYAMVKAKGTGDEEHQELVNQTKKWVAQTFYGELMKQMRNSPFKSKMLSGGRGGEAFGEMFDQKLAEKMANGSGRKLVDAIVNSVEAKKAYGGGAGHAKAPKHHNAVRRPAPNPTLARKEMEALNDTTTPRNQAVSAIFAGNPTGVGAGVVAH